MIAITTDSIPICLNSPARKFEVNTLPSAGFLLVEEFFSGDTCLDSSFGRIGLVVTGSGESVRVSELILDCEMPETSLGDAL